MIWFTSDLHLNHNKDFIYKARGFNTITTMNWSTLFRLKKKVKPEDDLYILGDIALGELEDVKLYLKLIPGKVHFIIGNHDTNRKIKYYEEIGWINEGYATVLRKGKWRFYLSHYPTLTANYDDDEKHLPLINLFGHTHQKNIFWNDNKYMVNVGVDAHDCAPIELSEIQNIIRTKVTK